jgi:tetratricopeptide (TPR) repeat protein
MNSLPANQTTVSAASPDPMLVFDDHPSPASWPAVSLCMIVKNEAKNLAACLESVGDLPGELIIVDTGSTDQTVEIAQSFNAIVKHFDWLDDFAAARNESIKDASGDWIFWLDADDRLMANEVVRLKNALISGRADAYRCRVVSHLAANRQPLETTYHTRLFQRRPGLCFTGAVHENITEAILRQGLIVAQTNITIQHVGYAQGEAVLRQKAERNGRILKEMVAANPRDLKLRYYLGLTWYQLADYAAAASEFEAVIAEPPPTLNPQSQLYKAHTLLISAYTHLAPPGQARQALARAIAAFPQRRHLWIVAGMLHLAQHHPEQAAAALAHAQTLSPSSDAEGESWPPGVLEEQLAQAYHQIGLKALRRKEFQQATSAFEAMAQIARPAQAAEAYKLQAVAFQKMQRQPEAIASWQKAQSILASTGTDFVHD